MIGSASATATERERPWPNRPITTTIAPARHSQSGGESASRQTSIACIASKSTRRTMYWSCAVAPTGSRIPAWGCPSPEKLATLSCEIVGNALSARHSAPCSRSSPRASTWSLVQGKAPSPNSPRFTRRCLNCAAGSPERQARGKRARGHHEVRMGLPCGIARLDDDRLRTLVSDLLESPVGAELPIYSQLQQLLHPGRAQIRPAARRRERGLENLPLPPFQSRWARPSLIPFCPGANHK